MSYPCITPQAVFRRLNTGDGRAVELTLHRKRADARSEADTEHRIAHLNESAEQVVLLCNGVSSIPDIARGLSEKYSKTAESEIAQRVEQILAPLVKDGFIAYLDKPLPSGQARPMPETVSLKNMLSGMFFEVTYACNLKCVHCAVDGVTEDQHALSFEMVKNLTDQFAAAGGHSVTLSGGEPLLRKDIYDILAYMSAKPLFLYMISNGILITKEVARKLKDSGLHGIQLSLDGHCAEIHDTYRGLPGAFDRTVRAITDLQEAGLDVDVACVVNRTNIEHTIELFDLCGQFGFTPFFSMQKAVGRALTQGRDYQISYQEYAQVKIKNNEHMIKLNRPNPFFVKDKGKKRLRCSAGVMNMAVRPNGDVVPCAEFSRPEDVLGNITRDNLVDMWNSDHPLLGMLRQKDPGLVKLCNGCKHLGYCSGGCPAAALRTWGDYYWPDLETCAYIALADQRLKVVENIKPTTESFTTCV